MDKLQQQIEFIEEIDRLKTIIRRTRLLVMKMNAGIERGSETLWELAKRLIDESVEKGYLENS